MRPNLHPHFRESGLLPGWAGRAHSSQLVRFITLQSRSASLVVGNVYICIYQENTSWTEKVVRSSWPDVLPVSYLHCVTWSFIQSHYQALPAHQTLSPCCPGLLQQGTHSTHQNLGIIRGPRTQIVKKGTLKKNIYLFIIYLFILAAPGLSCSMWDLQLWHADS